MWQRWGHKQPAISYPTHFTELDQDYGYDDRYLETIPEVDSISSRRQSAHIGLPELPFRAVPPMAEIPQPVNIYSQPSPVTPTGPPRDHGLRINVQLQDSAALVEDVSPLTPHTPQNRSQHEQPVSPIESVAPVQARAPLPEHSFPSQIPRKTSRPMESGGKAQTKWDEYSGEPTQDEAGKAASVRPGTEPVEMQYPHLKERTKQILAGLREREAAKKKPWGKAPPPVADDPLDDPPQREPWRGASGRAAIVEPVKNTAVVPVPPKIPARHPERNISRMNIHQSPTPQHQQPLQEAHPALRRKTSEESIRPIVPLKTRNLTHELVTKTPTQSPTKHSPPESPEPPIPQNTYVSEVSHPRVESPQYDPEPTTPTTPIPPPEAQINKLADIPEPYVPPEIGREQSRFSWTTYSTSTTESPRSIAQIVRDSSPPPPVPDLPSPIMIKKRPVSTSPFMHAQPYMYGQYANSSTSVVRKPLPVLSPRTSSIASATSRAMSTSKSLPPTPTVAEAADKIENLDAQLDSLNRRKHNITRIITDLQALLKKNAVVYDMWKRKEVEKNIINHRMELDDVGREIHEISLQLHRAQRKRDLEDNYGAPTGLWIKRVTS